jgi:PleD family two-component response regulator
VEEFLHRALLREVGVAVARHLLHQIGKTKGKVLDLLTRLKGEAFLLLLEVLQRRSAHTIFADACRGD